VVEAGGVDELRLCFEVIEGHEAAVRARVPGALLEDPVVGPLLAASVLRLGSVSLGRRASITSGVGKRRIADKRGRLNPGTTHISPRRLRNR
jgi:hypothetical protein